MLEGYTTLGFLAAHTSTVELQLLMTGVTYRHPGLLAKIVATLDVLSGGRAALGLGAAWYEREHRAYGVPFPSLKERFERLEETLRIVRQMWSDDDGPFEGTHYRLAETICAPQPLHRVPVMVGGNGERKTLRLVAQHADACNLVLGGDDPAAEARHKLAVLRAHCEDVGRPYDEVRRTAMLPGRWTRSAMPTASSPGWRSWPPPASRTSTSCHSVRPPPTRSASCATSAPTSFRASARSDAGPSPRPDAGDQRPAPAGPVSLCRGVVADLAWTGTVADGREGRCRDPGTSCNGSGLPARPVPPRPRASPRTGSPRSSAELEPVIALARRRAAGGVPDPPRRRARGGAATTAGGGAGRRPGRCRAPGGGSGTSRLQRCGSAARSRRRAPRSWPRPSATRRRCDDRAAERMPALRRPGADRDQGCPARRRRSHAGEHVLGGGRRPGQGVGQTATRRGRGPCARRRAGTRRGGERRSRRRPTGTTCTRVQSLAEAQHAVGASLLWNMRVLAGWLPRAGADVVRLLAAGFEVANLDEHLARLHGEPADPAYSLGTLDTAWSRLSGTTTLAGAADVLGDLVVAAARRRHATRSSTSVSGSPGPTPWSRGSRGGRVGRGRPRPCSSSARSVLEGRRLSPPLARRASYVLGPAFVDAACGPGRRTCRRCGRTAARATPGGSSRASTGSRTSGARRRAGGTGSSTTASRCCAGPRYDQRPVVGALAVLAVDAWRTRAALETAARGGAGAVLEAFDGVA